MVDAEGAVGKTIAAVCVEDGNVLVRFTDNTVAVIEGDGDDDRPSAHWLPLHWSPPRFEPHVLEAVGLIDRATAGERAAAAHKASRAAERASLEKRLAYLDRADG